MAVMYFPLSAEIDRFAIPRACKSPDLISSENRRTLSSDSLLRVGYGFLHCSNQIVLSIAKNVKDRALLDGNYFLVAEALNLRGLALFQKGSLDSSAQAYAEAVRICANYKYDNLQAYIKANLAMVKQEQSNSKEALALLAESRHYVDQMVDLNGRYWVAFNTARLFRYANLPKLSVNELEKQFHQSGINYRSPVHLVLLTELIEAYLEVEQFQRADSSLLLVLKMMRNCGSDYYAGEYYRLRGSYHSRLQNFQDAIRCFKIAEAFFAKGSFPAKVLTVRILLSEAYFESSDYIMAGQFVESVADDALDIGFVREAIRALYLEFSIYQKQNMPLTAQMYLIKALRLSRASSVKVLQSETFFGLYKSYRKLGNKDSAIHYFRQYSDVIYQQKSSAVRMDIDILEMYLENEQQENAYQLLKEKRENRLYLIYLLSGILVIMILIAILVVANQRSKQRLKEEVLREKLLRLQLNPHFLFNALLAIQSYVYKNDRKQASYFLQSFAKLIRLILDYAGQNLISISKEAEIMRYYLEIQSIRFEGVFSYTIEIDTQIDADRTMIPFMLAQPLLENCIEHGFHGIEESGKINLEYVLVDNHVMIIVRDNGVGMSERNSEYNESSAKHFSAAMGIIKERIDILNRTTGGSKISFKIKMVNKDEPLYKGTEVSFFVPYYIST